MKLGLASQKAIRYACKKFHYARSVPVNTLGFSVFNEENQWCGVILYGTGANYNMAKEFNLKQGQVLELVRVALNGKQGITSKALALSLRMLAKHAPLCRLVVSYADLDQGHTGTIYQATNWYYGGIRMEGKKDGSFIVNGKRYHGRVISNWVKRKGGLKGLTRKEFLQKHFDKNASEYISKGKLKYLYPIKSEMTCCCKNQAKPYLKKQTRQKHNE